MKKFTQLSLEQYLQELASDKAVPGGGSVSAYTASLAMGLIQMVGRISLKRKIKEGLSPEENQKQIMRRKSIDQIVFSVEEAATTAMEVVDLDPVVYEEVMSTWKDESKQEAALKKSYQMQADLAEIIVNTNQWNVHLAELVSGSIKNDLLVAASLLQAAFNGAYHTAMINVKYMKDENQKHLCESALHQMKVRYEKAAISE